MILTTSRLRLEPLADAHLTGLHRMNTDPEVMRYLTGRPETFEETRAGIERVKKRWSEWGYSWWAFIERGTEEIIGAGCIQHLGGDAKNPLELGYRLRRDKWGQGFASEAARAMAAFAFDMLVAKELKAICEPANEASSKVMRRLGMTYQGIERWHDADLAVYAIDRATWLRHHRSTDGVAT